MSVHEQTMIRVGTLEELRRDGARVVRSGGVPIAVYFHDGQVSAVDNRCPHMGFPLHKGTVKEGILTCHWHQARFDLCSGCTFDLWADDVLPYETRVTDGEVFVASAPRVRVDREYHQRRLVQGLQQNIDLIQAKSLLGLIEGGVAMPQLIGGVAAWGSRHHDAWGSGMTMLAIVANLLPVMKPETAYRAVAAAVGELADECSGAAPRHDRLPLAGAEHRADTLKRWLRHWTRTRHRDGAERTFVTAIGRDLPAGELADMLFTAACDRPFADIGHVFDFCNKAFELAEYLGGDALRHLAPLLMSGLVRARGGEESSHWHHPVDVVEPLRTVADSLPELMRVGAGRDWQDDGSLGEVLLGDDPIAIIEVLARSLSRGARPEELARRVAYAAAMRLARFATTNDVTDWFGPQHTFTYTNAVHQAVKREPTPDVVRAIFHGAIAVYMDRFLNVPPARLPGEGAALDDLPEGAEELRELLLETLDRRAKVDEAARIAARYLRLGHAPEELFDTLVHATVREDVDFHPLQVLEAGVRQFGEWEGRPEAEHILVGVVRNLAAMCPTRRARHQTATIAWRLHKQEKVYEEE